MSGRHTRGFTLIELLVVVAIIAILAAILFPVFAQAREKGRAVTCLSQMKQLGLGLHMYAQDYDEMLPPGNVVAGFNEPGAPPNFLGSLVPYAKNLAIFTCPNAINASAAGKQDAAQYDPTPSSSTNYMGNGVVMGRALAVVPNPSEIVYLQENNFKWSYAWLRPLFAGQQGGQRTYLWWHWDLGTGSPREQYSNLHSGGGNLVFADGHVKYKSVNSIRSKDFGLVPDDGHEANANKRYTNAF